MNTLKAMIPDDRPPELQVGALACALDLSGCLYLPDERILVVADLHLEKGSSRARRGFMLPPYDTRETLRRLGPVVEHHAPATVVALGDSFHDVGGPDRLAEEDRAALAALQKGRRWIWITGNHDRTISDMVGGESLDTLEIRGTTLRHDPTGGDGSEMAGHLHPVAKVVLRGRAVRRRCFVTDGARLVMPAFGAYAGGLNVLDSAFAPVFPRSFTAHMLGDTRIFAIGTGSLRGD